VLTALPAPHASAPPCASSVSSSADDRARVAAADNAELEDDLRRVRGERRTRQGGLALGIALLASAATLEGAVLHDVPALAVAPPLALGAAFAARSLPAGPLRGRPIALGTDVEVRVCVCDGALGVPSTKRVFGNRLTVARVACVPPPPGPAGGRERRRAVCAPDDQAGQGGSRRCPTRALLSARTRTTAHNED
jgi:hypothetical protein